MKHMIRTQNAPAAIGHYSQAIRSGNTVYLSGQIPLDPVTMLVVDGDISAQIKQVFENIKNVCEASGGNLDSIVKLTVYLIDIAHLATLNEIMATCFNEPYPARTSIAVSALPKGVGVEVEAIMVL